MLSIFKKVVVLILTLEARAVLWRYSPRIIAVTGSVGKTSTKDAIYAGLSGALHIRKSEKSLNSEVGVPLTILGCETGWKNPYRWLANIVRGLVLIVWKQKYPEWLVLEVGADRPGDISRIAKWLRPDIAVITAVPDVPAHVEFFASADDVAREKGSIALHLKESGKLILNTDDERVQKMRAEFRGISITYGVSSNADLTASHEEMLMEDGRAVGIKFRVNRAGSSIPVSMRGALGRPRIYSSLAACAVGEVAGVDIVAVAEGLSNYEPAPGRMRVLPGKHGALIIDDTYNSSPSAAKEALDALNAAAEGGRRIAVLGDMLELGRFSASAHREVGEKAASCADVLITVGMRSRAVAEAAIAAGMKEKNIKQYDAGESRNAGFDLATNLHEHDVILVKGSQGMRMEKAVQEILAETLNPKELLVRQNIEWERR